MLGKEVELGNLIHKFNAKDQADMCRHTAEAIADFAGVEHGRHMRMLVKKSNERSSQNHCPQGQRRTLWSWLQDDWRNVAQN